MAKITIFAGGFGSGKSELAINYALARSRHVDSIVLADLDLVNPYFASRDVKDLLKAHGIRLLAPAGELALADVPTIPAEIIKVLQSSEEVIIDVAGDEVGSMVLGYLSHYIKKRSYDFYLVINPYRPFARDMASIMGLKQGLEGAANLNFTGLISNPNLMMETNPVIIRSGQQMVLQYAQAMGLPVCYLTAEARFWDELVHEYGEILMPIKLYLNPEWLH